MSVKPVRVEEVDDSTIEVYNLPADGEYPVLAVDSSPEYYTAEWHTDLDVEEFSSVVELNTPGEFWEKDAVMTLEPEDKSGDVYKNEVSELLEKEGYPQDCTYFQVRGEEYDIGWEKLGGMNTVILTVDSHDVDPLSAFYERTVRKEVPEDIVSEALDQVNQIF